MATDTILPENIAVVGCGEVGTVVQKMTGAVHGIDPKFPDYNERIDAAYDAGIEAVHICLRYDNDGVIPEDAQDKFVNLVIDTFRSVFFRHRPKIVVIHSTVPPGTCRRISLALGHRAEATPIVIHAQIHGKHGSMQKYIEKHPIPFGCVGGRQHEAQPYLESVFGMEAEWVGTWEVSELGKLAATSLYAMMIVFHQTLSRMCKDVPVGPKLDGVSYLWNYAAENGIDIPDFSPAGKDPDVIGGHCLMQNLEILRQTFPEEPLWPALIQSNQMQKKQ